MWNADLNDGNYRNPILYADYSDPDAIRVGEDYYMVASSFCNAPGLPLLHSKDLVNWKVVNYVIDRIPEFRYRNPIHGCGVWAPSIRYHEGTYYVCFPMPDEGIYMCTTKDPLGKWSEPVNIRPGAGWIDPCPFWDEDGKAYLVAGVAKSRIGYKSVLHMVEMRPDGMGLIGEEVKIFDGNTNGNVTTEGPKMYKKNGYYYIFAPAGGVKTGWQIVLRSKNVYGPYEHKVVMRQGNSPVNGPHQGAWVDTVTGEDWFIHFQDVYAAGRICHLQPMHWENDWPVIGVNQPGNDYGEPVLTYQKPNVGKSDEQLRNEGCIPCEPATDDDFSADSLGLQWQWNANPDQEWYNLSGQNDGLKLNAVATTALRPVSDYRNLLLQKWPAPEFSCDTTMNLNGMQDGDMAGIVSLGMHYCAYAIAKVQDQFVLRQILGNQTFDCDVPYASQEVKELVVDADQLKKSGNQIIFRYTVQCTRKETKTEQSIPLYNMPVETITMEYSYDGTEFMDGFSIEAKAGRWVGVKNGVFCMHDNKSSAKDGYVTVKKVSYHNI